MNKTIAIIPARGGSKRLPGKNILDLGGIPLIAHSIIYALENTAIIDDVYVSTDNETIKQTALEYGAKVIDRPRSLASDTSTTVSTLVHALGVIQNNVENVVLLQPTNPLRPLPLLQDAMISFKEGGYDSLTTVSSNSLKFGKIDNGRFIPFNYTFGQRSQDMDPLYFENGLLYITKTHLILQQQRILDEDVYPFVIDHPFTTVDIDTMEDFEYAQFVMKKYSGD